jgi:hypothetical protein
LFHYGHAFGNIFFAEEKAGKKKNKLEKIPKTKGKIVNLLKGKKNAYHLFR